jgi:putative oxidoreductase
MNNLKKLFFGSGTTDFVSSNGILFLRISIGLMMLLGHGISKLQNFSSLKDSWPVAKIPLLEMMSNPISLMVTIFAEIIFSALIIVGFATRPAAFIFVFCMSVATFQIYDKSPLFMTNNIATTELPLLYLIPAIAILLTGAGRYSIDAKICATKRRMFH